ncbi:MAG TPA: hypothetical protein VFB80_04040 [Pirellulaceae bacterium]|nr:hypothetical protein [Pirellulaceae bacterium]
MKDTKWLAVGIVLGLVAPLRALPAQDDEAAVSRKRLALMEQTIASFVVKSDQIAAADRLKFPGVPLLRYSDPTRGTTEENVLIDATVWRLGAQGRPTGLVTLEIYRSTAETGILAYEFSSFVSDRFSLSGKTSAAVVWEAAGSALTLRPLGGAPPPARTAATRLVQLRQLARRFTVRETLKGDTIECRLLTAPLDRYQASADGIEDGALFAFANGTNPEVVVALECGPKSWTYGLARLSAAETAVHLDGREVMHYDKVDNARLRGDFTSRIERIELPK